ncbi:MAG: hypothetical protein IKW71_02965 [Elusimicrobiaceae bacterium]|nr:hypothetical protein [Elusimicrobiaceae bacterium]
MKYKSYSFLLFVFLLASGAGAQSVDLSTHVARAIAQAHQRQQAVVQVTSVFKKPVKMSDVMYRPTRGCKDQVISYQEKKNVCLGTLAQSGRRVYVTADCVTQEGYQLSLVTLKFANGKVAEGTSRAVAVLQDAAYIAVDAQVTRGLEGLAFARIADGQSLQETFGDKITDFLLSFFHTRGVSSRRVCRIGGSCNTAKPTLKVGEPVIYQGRVVALVKRVPRTLRRSVWGGVSEDALALIRL